MDAFDKIANAKPSAGGGNHIKDGHYPRVRVEKLTMHSGDSDTFFVAELRVVDAPRAILDDVTPNKQGSTVSFVQNLTAWKSAPGNVKSFMLAILGGLGVTEFGAATLREACSDANPLRGFDVEMTTYRKTARESKKVLTLPKWSVIEQTKEQIKAQRAALSERQAPAPTAETPAAAAPQTGGLLASIGIE